MDGFLEPVRNLWIKARLKAHPILQRTLILPLHEAKEIARLLARPWLPVYRLDGQAHGGPLTITYIGLEFAKPFLMSMLFAEDPVEQQVGRIPFWRYDELANLSSSDMIIVHAAKHLIRKLPLQNALVLPHYVHHILDVRGDWQDVRLRFRRTVRRHDLRRIRKYGYEYSVSHDLQDFETFYNQMYVPTMDGRHGELSEPLPKNELYQYFRHGHLFRITRDGDWVSGAVCHIQQKVLIGDASGVKHADEQLVREGATSAVYYASTHWANQHGYDAVNFLGTGPYMAQGLFRHKRSWGGAVCVPPHLHRQTWVKVCRITPAVSQFLKDNPFIVVDGEGRLHGLITVDEVHGVPDETKKRWEKDYVTPGLNSLLVRSINHFTDDPSNACEPDLVIPIQPGSNSGDRR